MNFKKDGSVVVDSTIDASLYWIFAFGAYRPNDEKVKNTMEQVVAHLSSAGGIARYENDPYYRQNSNSNPWFICTLWIAQYYIATGDQKNALRYLEWVADHALPSGVLAEQVNPQNGEPLSVSPLTWSHGSFIQTVQQFILHFK